MDSRFRGNDSVKTAAGGLELMHAKDDTDIFVLRMKI